MDLPEKKQLQAWDDAHLWHPFTPHSVYREEDPLLVVAGEGHYLIDADGKKYLDGVGSLWCNLFGHRKPEIDAAVHAQLDRSEHMDELLATAAQILGETLERFEEGIVSDLVRALKSIGIAAEWQDRGVSAKGLAEHLYATSQGWKQRKLGRTGYLERMRVAVRIVCRGASD